MSRPATRGMSLTGSMLGAGGAAPGKPKLPRRNGHPPPNKVSRSDLTVEMVRDRLDYDQLTGILVWKISPSNKWPAGTTAGTRQTTGYIGVKLFHYFYLAHRLAWFHVHGTFPLCIDHIDGNRSNNALSNLREATPSQNQANRPRLGCSYESKVGRFRSSITINGQIVWLGYFVTASAARAAYLAAHEKHHGAFSFTQRTASGQTTDTCGLSADRAEAK